MVGNEKVFWAAIFLVVGILTGSMVTERLYKPIISGLKADNKLLHNNVNQVRFRASSKVDQLLEEIETMRLNDIRCKQAFHSLGLDMEELEG